MEEDLYSQAGGEPDDATDDHLLGIDCGTRTQMEVAADLQSLLELLE